MTKHPLTAGLLMACLALQACSSRPREFTPHLSAAPPSASDYDAAVAACRELFVTGKLDTNGLNGSTMAGVGAGAGTAAVGSAAAGATSGLGGLAVAGATIMLLPFAVLGGAWGISRFKRSHKERAVRIALQRCLQERGYRVASWTKASKSKLAQPANLVRK